MLLLQTKAFPAVSGECTRTGSMRPAPSVLNTDGTRSLPATYPYGSQNSRK